MFRVDDLAGEEVVMDTTTGEHEEQIIEDISTAEPFTTASEVVPTTVKDSAASTIDLTKDEITMAQALAALKSIKPKVVVQEQEMSTTIPAAATIVTTAVPTLRAKCIVFHEQKQSQIPTFSSSKDKGKAKMIESEVSIKKKDQMRIVKTIMDADRLFAKRLQAREREEFSEVQKERLLVKLIEKRKKHFAALRAQEKRNKPPTKTQIKLQMSTYLKHMGGYKQSHLKGRSFYEIKKLFDREIRKVNAFIAMDSKSQESSTKRTAEHLESDISKKQKVDENVKPVINDSKELQKYMKIVLDDADESMRMEQYLTHTDYALWKVIINGDSPVPEPPAVAILDEHLLKFHSIKDAKSLWEAIKIRFGGNKKSKKMHKTILKQQYDNFIASRSKGLDKTYDRLQKLISQLKLNGEVISHEDANMKLIRSLPPAWNNIALIMRNKRDIETLSTDDLYNNLKVYEAEIKGQSSSSSNSHNVAFVSSKNTSSINKTLNVAHDIPATGSKEQPSASSYADDVMFSFFTSQSNTPQLENKDLEQIDTDDLEEMDLKCQLAMITMRVKNFIKKTGRNLNFNGKEPVGFDKTRVECYNCYRRRHFAREFRILRNQGNKNGDNDRRVVPVETRVSALVVQDGLSGYDWNYQAEKGPTNFELMEHSSDSTNSEDQGIFDSGCSRHMTGNKSFLTEYQKIDGGFVAFGGSHKGGIENQLN
uniref:Retrovirus-related Pol polyprotein from transposon TNT 1-94-like beta-barrel domain-containing protein n=1 Tax=Tanacetum cinerariifolium TaxID=118510 RepID=A0A6L2KNE0_TANCI|nr:hypothetical protein [Tanacetum cinerariifolium]